MKGRFKLLGETSYTFDVAAHKAEFALVVDPTLLYSTFLGGSAGNNPNTHNDEVAVGIAVDTTGSAYVTGYTASTDFPITPGAFQTSSAGWAFFITKLNPTGSALVYSTYLGVASYVSSVALDAQGDAYVAGSNVQSSFGTFPITPNAYSQSCQQGAGFLTVLNPSGSGLVYSTCFGDRGPVVASMTADPNGHALVTGYLGLNGETIPTTPNAYQSSYPGGRGTSAFAMAFDTNSSGASSLTYSTYFGIPSDNYHAYGVAAYAVAADLYGNMYITGYAGDTLPVTPGAFQTDMGWGVMCNPYGGEEWTCPDGFVAKLNPHASGAQSLIYSTYLGGPGRDAGLAIAVDGSGNAYVTGYTFSNNFPVTAGGFQTVYQGGVASFVSKLNPGGSNLVYSTYLEGTSGGDVVGQGSGGSFR